MKVIEKTKARILCVDDDRDTTDFLAELLRYAGYSVLIATSAAEAVELLRRHPVEVIISDYMLPDKTGITLLREALSEGLIDLTACILFTAHPDPEPLEGVKVVHKPLHVERFLQTIGRLVVHAQGRQERS